MYLGLETLKNTKASTTLVIIRALIVIITITVISSSTRFTRPRYDVVAMGSDVIANNRVCIDCT